MSESLATTMSRRPNEADDYSRYRPHQHPQDLERLEAVFDQVTGLVRNPPSEGGPVSDGARRSGSSSTSSSSSSSSSDDEKLRLYGLYKRVRDGPCRGVDNDGADGKPAAPPVFQPVARSKYFAWQDCSSLSRAQAMTEYIKLISRRRDVLGDECRRLWKALCDQADQDRETDVTERRCSTSTPLHVPFISEDGTLDPQISTMPTKGKETVQSSGRATSRMEFQPLVPRGRLDISFDDLWFALRQCLYRSNNHRDWDALTDQIASLWQESAAGGGGRSVAVGLSVRSLFDLYLTMKGYPDQSEVLVVPPISVPGMMLVAKYHNLRIVPVDIDLTHQRWIDLPSLRSKITDRTVAILLVHPFGMVTTDQETFSQLRALSDEHGLELWEDCAECFTGLNDQIGEHGCCYLGNPLADLRYFSFGPIKTATALGGGIAVFRDAGACQRIERLQQALYHEKQTRREYLGRVLVAFILNFIAASPVRVGLLNFCCQLAGVNFDRLVTSAVRGFRVPNTSTFSVSSTPAKGGDDLRAQSHLIRQIRRRPSLALLSVLKRRLEQSNRVAPSLPERIKRCRRVRSMIQERLPHLAFPDLGTFVDTYWAFPICCEKDRDSFSRRMLDLGFDVVSGASQLCSVSKFVDECSDDGKIGCRGTDSLMDSVLYLPICSQHLSESQLADIVDCLEEASTKILNPVNRRRERRTIFFVFEYPALLSLISLGLVVLTVATRLMDIDKQLARIIGYFFRLMVCYFLVRLGVQVLLVWTTARFYLRETSAFAEHCDMIDAPRHDAQKDDNQSADVVTTRIDVDVLSSIDALKFSPVVSQRDVAMGRKVILTGATGFVGSALLRDLLLNRESLSLDYVIVICRRKGNASAEERIVELLSQPLFAFLSDEEKLSRVKVLNGDVTLVSAGLSSVDQAALFHDLSISHVFHCAAVVNFNQEFPDAARSNITSALTMQSLTARLKSKDALFVHVSTAFVHGDQTGSRSFPLSEELFCFEPFDPVMIYKSMLGTQYYASTAMSELRFHNTYSFSKSVCEHLLSQQNQVDTIIIRPSIVGPAVERPFEGWAGDRPSTIVAGPCLHLSHQWNVWFLGRENVAYIPVDVLARFILAKSCGRELRHTPASQDTASSSEGSFDHVSRVSDDTSELDDATSIESSEESLCRSPFIFNATWDANSSDVADFSWLEFSVAYLQLGSVFGYFSRSSAMVQLLISAQLIPRLVPGHQMFNWFHATLVKLPIHAVISGCLYLGVSNRGIDKITPYLDLPLLFYPFMRSNFYFQSDLTAPECFNSKRYSFSCGVAAHRFIAARRAQQDATGGYQPRMSSTVVGGKRSARVSFFWWAFSQPRGDFFTRVIAACVGYLLWAICTVITVDVVSFRNHLSALRSTTQEPVYLILAPTHRSFLDFVLLSYIFFALPELQIDLPFIVAADEFKRLPVIGQIARLLRAFYIQRGRQRVDKTLPLQLSKLKSRSLGTPGSCLELFIEGKRSRDRRFVHPKTGLLKCLKESGGEHVILPITINYEMIPEQDILSQEAAGSDRRMLNLSGMIFWVKEALVGNINIGKIHVAASDPVRMRCSNDADFRSMVQQIQLKQRDHVKVSEYHVKAASSFFNVDEATMKGTMKKLGCNLWAETEDVEIPMLPTDPSSLFTVVLQFAHILAPLVSGKRNEWSAWLDSLHAYPAPKTIVMDDDIKDLCRTLEHYFDLADARVDKAIETLKAAGFRQLQLEHVLQTAKSSSTSDLPFIFLNAAVHMKTDRLHEIDHTPNNSVLDLPHTIVSDTVEKLGFWGFADSGFVAKLNRHGGRYVTMRGSRYGLCGKSMTDLLPFIESALRVKINFSNEFIEFSSAWCKDIVCDLSSDDKKFLESEFDGLVSVSTVDRARHGTGQSQEDIFHLRNGHAIRIPDAIVWPCTETHVKSLVDAARCRGWCLIPFGGGTNVINATRCPTKDVEPRPIVSVDMKRMNRILWLNEEDGLANVEAGITGRELVELLEMRGYTMGHEPDSIEFSTLGGWIATKASGMKRSKYGNIEDIAVSTRVVSSEGLLWKGEDENSRTSPGRSAEGLDVCSIAIGSEGCLGIITSAIIRILPLPEVKKYDSTLFPTFEHGLRFLRALSRERQAMPACVRLLDNSHFQLGQALRPENSSSFQSLKEAMTKLWTFYSLSDRFNRERVVCATFSFEGSAVEVRNQSIQINKLARIHGGISLGPKVGQAGYELTFMIAYLRDFAMTYHILGESFETFVPWSKIESLVSATKDRIKKEHAIRLLPGVPFVGCRVTQLYHEGVCLYFYLCISFDGVNRASEVFAELEHVARDEILKQGGSLSHHHGVGKLRASYLNDRSSAGFRKVASSIKSSVDEENIFGARNGLFASS